MQATYTRLFTDSNGDSCFQDVQVALQPHGFTLQRAEALAFAPFLANQGSFWAGAPMT